MNHHNYTIKYLVVLLMFSNFVSFAGKNNSKKRKLTPDTDIYLVSDDELRSIDKMGLLKRNFPKDVRNCIADLIMQKPENKNFIDQLSLCREEEVACTPMTLSLDASFNAIRELADYPRSPQKQQKYIAGQLSEGKIAVWNIDSGVLCNQFDCECYTVKKLWINGDTLIILKKHSDFLMLNVYDIASQKCITSEKLKLSDDVVVIDENTYYVFTYIDHEKRFYYKKTFFGSESLEDPNFFSITGECKFSITNMCKYDVQSNKVVMIPYHLLNVCVLSLNCNNFADKMSTLNIRCFTDPVGCDLNKLIVLRYPRKGTKQVCFYGIDDLKKKCVDGIDLIENEDIRNVFAISNNLFAMWTRDDRWQYIRFIVLTDYIYRLAKSYLRFKQSEVQKIISNNNKLIVLFSNGALKVYDVFGNCNAVTNFFNTRMTCAQAILFTYLGKAEFAGKKLKIKKDSILSDLYTALQNKIKKELTADVASAIIKKLDNIVAKTND